MDLEGNQYDPNEYNHFDATKEHPLYYITKYEIELFKENSDEQVVPSKLQIYGYGSMEDLEKVVDIQLD